MKGGRLKGKSFFVTKIVNFKIGNIKLTAGIGILIQSDSLPMLALFCTWYHNAMMIAVDALDESFLLLKASPKNDQSSFLTT